MDRTIPFYVENITNTTETLTISGYNNDEVGEYLQFVVEISTDGTTWTTFDTTGATPLTRALQPGDKVYLRANTDYWCTWGENEDYEWIEHGCTILGVSKVGGNTMSLLYGNNFSGNETAFPTDSDAVLARLFKNNDTLIDASELLLPATTLANYCYQEMFSDCTSLTTAPALPATTLTFQCYDSMFYNCTSLTTTPLLSATTLADSCYQNMFHNCTSLTTAPALPATTLTEQCYSMMFYDCTNLNHIECLATDISASGCTTNWVKNVASRGTFVKDPNTSWSTGVNGIPSGWTVEDAQ